MVFSLHPDAAHFRYPYVYGPYQLVPREWLVVRRVLDGRRRIVVADDGLTLHHHGYTENLAHALLLAFEQPDAAAGKIFNVGDEEVLSVRQVVEIVAGALGHEFEIVSMPYDLAVPARPLVAQPLPTHRVLDLTRLRSDLGYRDLVPAREALARTGTWLAEHPLERGAQEERVLTDPFDYEAEDRFIDAWNMARASMPTIAFEQEPMYGMAYSGPGGRPRTASRLRHVSVQRGWQCWCSRRWCSAIALHSRSLNRRRASMSTRNLYLYEVVDIVGQGQYAYMEHLWQDPVLRMPEMFGLQGSFYVCAAAGGRWPQVINIWDVGAQGWLGWAANVDRMNLKRRKAFYGDWWDQAAEWRSGWLRPAVRRRARQPDHRGDRGARHPRHVVRERDPHGARRERNSSSSPRWSTSGCPSCVSTGTNPRGCTRCSRISTKW